MTLNSATHTIPPEIGGKWGTEYLNTRFSLSTPCAGYSVKLMSRWMCNYWVNIYQEMCVVLTLSTPIIGSTSRFQDQCMLWSNKLDLAVSTSIIWPLFIALYTYILFIIFLKPQYFYMRKHIIILKYLYVLVYIKYFISKYMFSLEILKWNATLVTVQVEFAFKLPVANYFSCMVKRLKAFIVLTNNIRFLSDLISCYIWIFLLFYGSGQVGAV